VSDYEYDVVGTLCEPVVENRSLVHIPDRVVEFDPGDPDLKQVNAVNYIGVPLLALDGQVIGHLAVLDTKPMPEDSRYLAIFQIFAARRGRGTRATGRVGAPRAR
jgi:GAF domain-containing protein